MALAFLAPSGVGRVARAPPAQAAQFVPTAPSPLSAAAAAPLLASSASLPLLLGLGAGLAAASRQRRRSRGRDACASTAAAAAQAAPAVDVEAEEGESLREAAASAVREALGDQWPPQAQASGSRGPLRPLIVAMGTRGDVEPGLRLAAALRDRGHDPLVLSLSAYEAEVVGRWGLPFRPCGLDRIPMSEAYLEGQTRADQVYADRGWYGDAWVPVGRCMYEAAVQHRCDLIVATSMGNTHALDVAENLGVLCVALKFCPDIDGQVPTATFPPSGYPLGMPGPLNTAAHVLENLRTVGAVFAGGFIPRVISFRSELGFPSMKIAEDVEVPTYSPYRQVLQANQPCIYAFSQALATRPPEYQSWHFVTGALGRTDAEAAAVQAAVLPEALEHFLGGDAGIDRAPVCIAFGSITLARSAPFQERALKAVRQLGLRAVVVDPEAREEGVAAADKDVFHIRSAPYAALFRRCCLVIHHGGAGTMQDSLWAGVPQVAAPVLRWSDQPFWADELEARGLGVALGRGGEVPEAAAWSEAITRALESRAAIQAAAATAASSVARERGAAAACDILEGLVRDPAAASKA